MSKMDDTSKIKLLEYWLANPDKWMQIPKELEGNIKREDIAKLMLEIEPSKDSVGGTSTVKGSDFFKHAEKIRKKLKEELEIKSLELQNDVLKKQVELQKNLNKIQSETNEIMEKQNNMQDDANKILTEQTRLHGESTSIARKQSELQEDLNKKQGETINISKRQIVIGVLQVIATIALIIATVYLGSRSNEISEIQNNITAVQTDIIKRANPSFEPFIDIVPDFDDLVIPAWEINNERDLYRTNDNKWARIELTFYNFGKMDSQHLYCHPVSGNDKLMGYITPNSNIRNLPAGTSNRSVLHIRYWDCQKDSLEGCEPDLVPLGLQNITLDCECRGCKTQHTFQVPIEYCIYNKNQTSECPEGILDNN